MSPVIHKRLSVVLDVVALADDDQGRTLVTRLVKARPGLVGLRLAYREDDTLWLEQQVQDSSGSSWWPVCQIKPLSLEVL